MDCLHSDKPKTHSVFLPLLGHFLYCTSVSCYVKHMLHSPGQCTLREPSITLFQWHLRDIFPYSSQQLTFRFCYHDLSRGHMLTIQEKLLLGFPATGLQGSACLKETVSHVGCATQFAQMKRGTLEMYFSCFQQAAWRTVDCRKEEEIQDDDSFTRSQPVCIGL